MDKAEPRILHVGCGPQKISGAIGIDINPASAADVIHDLQKFPYPFANDAFDLIICDHVLEHLDDVPAVLEELHRVAAREARIEIRVPHYSSVYYYRDPTHRHAFSLRSMDYFLEGTELGRFAYTKAKFRLLKAELSPPANVGPIKRAVYRLFNRYGDLWERYFAFIVPRHLLFFALSPLKDGPSDTEKTLSC